MTFVVCTISIRIWLPMTGPTEIVPLPSRVFRKDGRVLLPR